ncbi:MAG: hypothetical protein R3338_14715, partial [Thermoanaerobaculia bacterium]|nr:hypothetical protein [Thermoanaerobaculia bacterium]
LPFLWFLSGRTPTVVLTALYSLQLIASYTIWSGSFAWWYADAIRHSMRIELTVLAIPVWIVTGVVLVRSVGERISAVQRPRPQNGERNSTDEDQTTR